MHKTFHGIFPALPTPMTSHEVIDLDVLGQFVDSLIGEGVHGVIPLGSTGEFYALSPEEREAVLKTTLDAVAGRVPVVAGANAASTHDVIRYCCQAQELGASGVLLAAPYYSLPTPDELYAHILDVEEAIDLPIMLYNYPGRTGIDMAPDLVERLAALDQVQYIKESTGDITRVSEISARCGNAITAFCGGDGIVLESFVLGAAGWVSGVANFLPKHCVRLYDLAVVQGDFTAARDLTYQLLPLLMLLENGGKYTQFVKAACELTGHPIGPPRRPLRPATPEEVQCLRDLLRPLE